MASLKYTVDVDTRGAKASLASLESSIGNLGAAIAGGFAVGEIVRFGDSIIGLQNKLRSLTGDQALVNSMFNDITRIAGAARAPLQETGDLYFRIARAAKDLGISQQETSDITESLAKSMSMTGATAQETSGALLQLGQALQSGRFQGDELRSVLENMPIVSKAMADELGVTIGELRKLGSEGKITSDVFVRAMQKNKKAIDDAFARSVPTAEQALNNLKTAAAVAFSDLAKDGDTPAGAIAKLGEGLLKLTNDVPKLTAVIKDLTNALVAIGIAFAAFKGYALVTTTIFPRLLGGITSVSGAFTALAGGARSSIFAMLGISAEANKIRNSMVGIGTAFGIFDAGRGKIMRTTKDMGVLGTSLGRVGQLMLSLTNIFGAVLRIGLRFAGWVGVFLAVVDVINLLYKAVTGSNEKLIDMGGILKGVWTVMRVLWGLLKVVGGYIGSFFAPVVQALANGWNSFMSAVMNTGPMKAAASMLSWVGEKLAWLWKMARDISGVTAADQKATMDKIMSVPISDVVSQWEKDQKSLGKPGLKPKKNDVFGDTSTKVAPGGGGGGKSAKETAKEQAEALREVKKAIMEVTAAYREQAATRLDDLNFQLKSLTMSEDQVQLEQNRKDILKEQADTLKDLATKEAEIKNNKDLSNKGRQEALALIAQERAAIQSATQEELAASEATIKAIQAKNIEIEKATKLMELQQKANENKAALTALEDQIKLIGLYGDKLEDTTAQLELQNELRQIDVDFQNQLLELENRRTKLGEERYAMELALLQQGKQQAIEAANAQAGAEKKLLDLRRKSERTDVKAAIGKRMEELARSVDPAITAVEGLNSVFDNMGNAIDNFVDTGKFKFGDFARSIIADLAKIALKAAATRLITSIFGGIFGKAAGGPVMAGKPYVVGEQGPELFVPNSAGSIMTNASMNKNAGGDMGGQPVINNITNITNNISAIDSRSVAQMFVENRKSLLGAATMARKELPYG